LKMLIYRSKIGWFVFSQITVLIDIFLKKDNSTSINNFLEEFLKCFRLILILSRK
jgi:hypothetical protein